tara:strand:+ start:1299 stop:2006 length:708 start_codon:yes stop_codon:yes gene_type:complete
MAMRSQVYEWDAGETAGSATALTTVGTNEGNTYSIFIGGVGGNISKPASTSATQFIVVEDIGCTPTEFHGPRSMASVAITEYRGLCGSLGGVISGPRAYLQVRINTTDYFLDPDGVGNDGVPGTAAPYPVEEWRQGNFNLYPAVYILPGQTWDVRVTYYNGTGVETTAGTATLVGPTAGVGRLQAFVKYTLYDGPDALIANKLLEMGVSVNPGNVDWYKRSLLEGSTPNPAEASA